MASTTKKVTVSASIAGSLVALLFLTLPPGVIVEGLNDTSLLGPCSGMIGDPCIAYFNITTFNAGYTYRASSILKEASLDVTGPVTEVNLFLRNNSIPCLDEIHCDNWRMLDLTRDKFQKGSRYELKIEIYKKDPSANVKWGIGKIIDPVFVGYNATQFISYYNGDTAKCFNYDCTRDPIIARICNPTPVTFKENASKFNIQVITPISGHSVEQQVGFFTNHYLRNRTVIMMESCERTILNNASIPVNETYQCNKRNTTVEEEILEPLLLFDREIVLLPRTCYNVTLPFRSVNIPSRTGAVDWQLNLSSYGSIAVHPMYNTNNYTQPFLNNTEANGTSAGYNASIKNGYVYANVSAFKSGNWYNLTTVNATSGYEPFWFGSGSGCADPYGIQDQNCSGNDQRLFCADTPFAICLNLTQKVTLLYAEHFIDDAGGATVEKQEWYFTETRPINQTNFNASEMIKNQTVAETGVADCVSVNSSNISSLTNSLLPREGSIFCIRALTMGGGAKFRISEIELYTANFTLNSQLQSGVIGMPANMSSFKIAANMTTYGGIIGFNVSCDGGANYASATSTNFGSSVSCTQGDKLTYRIVLEANSTTNALSPLVDRIDMEFFQGAVIPAGTVKLIISVTNNKWTANLTSQNVTVNRTCFGDANCTSTTQLQYA